MLYDLHFQIMVAGTQGTHFATLAFFGQFRDILRYSTGHASIFFHIFQISRITITLFHSPLRAAEEYLVELVQIQTDIAFFTDTSRNPPASIGNSDARGS